MQTSPWWRCLAAGVMGAMVWGAVQAAPNLRLMSQAHQDGIWSMAADANEQTLLTVSEDKTAKLWELASGRLLRSFAPPAGPGSGRLYGAGLSPDGSTVALGGDYKRKRGDHAVYLYKAADGSALPALGGLPGLPLRVGFSPDGRWLAVSVERLGMVVYDTRTWQPVLREDCGACVRAELDFSRDGQLLVSASQSGAVTAYRLSGGTWAVSQRATVPPGLLKLAVHPTGKWVAIGHHQVGAVSVLDGQTLAPAHQPAFSLRNVLTRAVAWSADGRSLYASGLWYQPRGRVAEPVIRRWDDEGRGPAQDLRSPTISSGVSSLLPLKDGGVVAGDVDGDLLRLGPDGREVFAVTNELSLSIQSESANSPDLFRVAEDGSALEFRRRGDVLARGLLINERRWGTRLGVAWAPRGLRGRDAVLEDWAQSPTPRLNGKVLDMGPGMRLTSYAFSPDGQWLAVGTNRHLRLYDVATGARVRQLPVSRGVTGVRFFKGGEALAAQSFDGRVLVLRRHDFRRLLDVYLHPNGRDWALYTPAGYFDASPGAEALLGWHVTRADETDGVVHPFSRFAETLHRPDLVDRVLAELKTDRELLGDTRPQARTERVDPAAAGAEPAAEEAPQALIDQADRAPRATLEVAPRALEPDVRSVTLLVGATDLGDGIAEMRVFHNGKALPVDWDAARRQASVRSALLPGANEFRAVALGRSRIEGVPALLRVADTPRPEAQVAGAGRLHAVVVAVGQYRNAGLNLSYPVKDARAVLSALQRAPFQRVHGEPVVHALLDREATGTAVRELFLRLRREVRAEDTVAVFLAGHGETEADEWYFVPHELETPEVPDKLKAGGLSRSFWQQALRELPARRVLLMIDACKSGAALTRSVEARRALMQLARSSGTYILAATQADQLAWEVPGIGHGVFTHALLESLKAPPSGKQLSVETLIAQVKATMPDLADQHLKVRQVPVSFGLGTDFPLAVFE